MCFSTLAPHTPSTESESPSPTQQIASLSSQLFASVPSSVSAEGSIRKRVVRACEVCRRKKVKCNGQKPCSQCIAFAEECNYVDVKDRSAYSRRYVESLEARIAKMEKLVTELYARPIRDGSRDLPHPTGTMMRQGVPGAVDAAYHQQWQDDQEYPAPGSRIFSSSDRKQLQLSLGHSIDLCPLSANHMIEQADAALRPQEGQHIPAPTTSDINQADVQHQATESSTFQLPSHLKHDLDFSSMDPRLPTEADFIALLDAYSHRVFPFVSIVCPSEVHSAWTRLSLIQDSLPLQFSSEVALILAVLACGAQATDFGAAPAPTRTGHASSSSGMPLPRLSSNILVARAATWSRAMHDVDQRDRQEVTRQSQVNALLSLHTAGQGDLKLAFGHIAKARYLLGLSAQQDEPNTGHLQLSASIELLDYIVRSSLGRMATREQSLGFFRPNGQLNSHSSGSSSLLSALTDLSALCGQAGSVGCTLRELIEARSCSSDVAGISACARDRDQLLLGWYNSLPFVLKSAPSSASDVTSMMAACIASVSLQFERLRLHVALQHFLWRQGNTLAGDVERFHLSRCLHLAGETIRMFPKICRYLPPSPWLMINVQCLAMSASLLMLTAIRQPDHHVVGLLAEIETALTGLEQLENLMQGVVEIRTRLVRLNNAVKSRCSYVAKAKSDKRRVEEDGHGLQENCVTRRTAVGDKRIRAATMPENSPQVAVSPITRAETAPPVSQEQSPSLSLATSSEPATSKYYPSTPVQVAAPSLQWPAHDNAQSGTGDLASFSPFWNAATSVLNFQIPQQQGQQQHRRQQHPQQQHDGPIIASQTQGPSFDLQQQQLMAGLLDDIMIQDQ